jgi:hypothetical protein
MRIFFEGHKIECNHMLQCTRTHKRKYKIRNLRSKRENAMIYHNQSYGTILWRIQAKCLTSPYVVTFKMQYAILGVKILHA